MVQEGQDFLWPGMSDNSEVAIEEVGSGESGGLGSRAGDGEVKLSRSIGGRKRDIERGRIQDIQELRQAIDPTAIQRRRSDAAREADQAKDARLTSDPLQWASDPKHYDFPGVDTGPKFREEEGEDFDTDSFLENLF